MHLGGVHVVSGKELSAPKNIEIYFTMKTCCALKLKALHRDASYEYPQHPFSLRSKKNIYLYILTVIKPLPLSGLIEQLTHYIFSSPEQKLRVSYCHHPMSVVVRRPSSTISLLTL